MARRTLSFFLAVLICLGLTGCSSPAETVTETTAPPTQITTAPPHSQLLLEGISQEDAITYFNEVCLDAEFTYGSGDASLVQKWLDPIYYCVLGAPTEADLEKIQYFAQWLNTIEGFPGMYQTDREADANLRIYFVTAEELVQSAGEEYRDCDGCVRFWYMDNVIYDEVIYIRTDIDQFVRNSVILEEMYNGLGPGQDTWLRPDSIIYADYSEPQELTPVDQLILKLLYHPSIACGMDAAACAPLIRALYY